MSLLKKIVALVIVVLAGAWAYYTNVSSSKPSMDMNMRIASGNIPFPVTLASVDRGRITGSVTYTGSVAALNEEDIYPRVTGRIVEMRVYPGDRVEKGQVVARLDDIELNSKVQEAEGMLATSQANRLQMEADLAAARQEVIHMEKELAMADAELTYARSVVARTERLFNSGAVSRQEYESDRSMVAVSEAKREAALAKLEQTHAMEVASRKKIAAADAMVAQGKAAVRTTEIVRGYVDIVAPSSGYVVKRLVAPGVLVQPGMAILKTVQIDRVRLQANVGEKDLTSIRVGSPVTVTTTANDQPALNARVTSVSPFVDQGARTAVVEAIVDNASRRYTSGQYVLMQFTTGEHKEALSVPSRAVSRLGGKATVWVLKDEDRVEPREVTTGLEIPERVEILNGLTGGERVVAQGYEGLYAGARVSEVVAAMPATSKEPDKASDTPADMKDMPGHGGETKMAQAGGGAAPMQKLQIALATNPVKLSSGNAKLRIEVKDASGAAVSDAKVEVSAGMPGMDVPKTVARAAKEAGVYEATLKLGMAGAWTVQVTATSPQGMTTTAKINLEAK
jgi:multidrug efflux pump subunit AcrA (membrane-fusion protein)